MLIRNSILYVAARLVPGVIGMVTTALLTRLLDPAQYGLYGLALVVMTFGSSMAFDWLGLTFLRIYQTRRDDPLVISTIVQIFFVLVLATVLLASAAWGLGMFASATAPAYAIGIVMMWGYAWFELVSQFEIANFRPARYMRMNFGRAVFIFAGAAGLAAVTRDPFWTAAGTAAGMLAGALLGGFSGWRFGRRHFDPVLARMMLGFGLPLAASLTMNSLVNSGIRILVQRLGSDEALGLYTVAFLLVQNTITMVASGIASASYSIAVQAVESGDPAVARRQLLSNGSLLLAVLSPMAVGLALTAHAVAATLVGSKYVAAVTALTPWMAAGSFFANFRAHYLDHAFQLGRQPNLQVWVMGVAALLTVALSLWLIPWLGATGGAMAVTVAMAVSCVHAIIAGRRAYRVPLPLDASWRIAAACLLMTPCILLVPGHDARALVGKVMFGATGFVLAAIGLNLLGLRGRALTMLSGAAARDAS